MNPVKKKRDEELANDLRLLADWYEGNGLIRVHALAQLVKRVISQLLEDFL